MQKTSLASIVRRKIDNMVFIRDALKEEVLNYTALARKIKSEVEEEFGRTVTREAIVLAAMRYEKELKHEKYSQIVMETLKNAKISLFSGLEDICIERNEKVEEAVYEILKKVDWSRGERLYFNLASGEVEIVLQEERAKELLSRIPADVLIKRMSNLVAFEFKDMGAAFEPLGLFYFLTGVFARNSINVIHMGSTVNEVVFILSEDDATRAFEIFKNIRKSIANQDHPKDSKNPE